MLVVTTHCLNCPASMRLMRSFVASYVELQRSLGIPWHIMQHQLCMPSPCVEVSAVNQPLALVRVITIDLQLHNLS